MKTIVRVVLRANDKMLRVVFDNGEDVVVEYDALSAEQKKMVDDLLALANVVAASE